MHVEESLRNYMPEFVVRCDVDDSRICFHSSGAEMNLPDVDELAEKLIRLQLPEGTAVDESLFESLPNLRSVYIGDMLAWGERYSFDESRTREW